MEKKYLLLKDDVVDNLTSTDTDKPLSANQGKVLKDALDNIPSPTGTVEDNVGTVYYDGGWKLSPYYGYINAEHIVNGNVNIVETSETGSYHWYDIGVPTSTPLSVAKGRIFMDIGTASEPNIITYDMWESGIEPNVYYVSEISIGDEPVLDEEHNIAIRIDMNTNMVSAAGYYQFEGTIKVDMLSDIVQFDTNYIPSLEISKINGLTDKFNSYLKLSGGKMDGGIIFACSDDNCEFVKQNKNTKFVSLYGGDGEGDGAGIILAGREYSEENKGAFQIIACNGSESPALIGKPDGTLMWGDKDIFTSAGGTMSGAIAMGNNKITGLGTPTDSDDASTKAYVDAKQAQHLTISGELLGADWDSTTKKQTISMGGVLSSNTVFVSPAPSYCIAYGESNIRCIEQGTDTLTFKCDDIPSSDITVNAVIFN